MTSLNKTLFLFQSDEAQYDHSELLLYQAEILKEAGLHRQSMTHLDKHKSQILDKLGFLELKGTVLSLLHYSSIIKF